MIKIIFKYKMVNRIFRTLLNLNKKIFISVKVY